MHCGVALWSAKRREILWGTVDELCLPPKAGLSAVSFRHRPRFPNFLPDRIALYASVFDYDSDWDYSA